MVPKCCCDFHIYLRFCVLLSWNDTNMHTCNAIHYIPDNTFRVETPRLLLYDINGQYVTSQITL